MSQLRLRTACVGLALLVAGICYFWARVDLKDFLFITMPVLAGFTLARIIEIAISLRRKA